MYSADLTGLDLLTNDMMRNILTFLYGIMLVFVGCSPMAEDITGPVTENERRADSVLQLMTLDEKIGQMVSYTSHWDVTGPVVSTDIERYIREGMCGAIFNAHEVSFNRGLQELAVNKTRLGIPLLFGYDVVHGHRTIFPIPLGASSSWDPELIERAARVAAIEATACGVNWTFAPMVDISFDPRWGRVAESAGEDPYLASVIAQANVRGFQGNDLTAENTLLACMKHFAAYGAPQAGRDYHTVDMSDRVLREFYLPPFKSAVNTGVASAMTSFNELDGIPATGSKYLLTDILREEWGFEGFVVTDYNSIVEMIAHGVAEDTARAAELAVEAGVNMDLQSSAYRTALNALVNSGRVSEELIDKAVFRILEAKVKLGLFDDPYKYFSLERQNNQLSTPEHLQVAYDLAASSIVLLKNENSILPLDKGTNIALIGPHATLQRDLLGSWIADGRSGNLQTIREAVELVNGSASTRYAKGCWFDETDESGFEEAIRVARDAEVILLAMGESWHWSGEAASRTSIRIPEIQTKLIKKLKTLGKPMVLVLLNGRPLELEEEIEMVDALVEAWFPGTKGARAIADVLFGNVNPSGKLTMTFPRNIGQVPIHYHMKNTGRPIDPEDPDYKYTSRYLDSPNEPLFPFGFGLGYSAFEYSGLSLDKYTMFPGDSIRVSCTVHNTGDRDGFETVQLYIRDLVGSVTRPVKELKDFKKVLVTSGEKTEVSFIISDKDLSFYRADMTYGTEPGNFSVFVGGNSRDLLKTEFMLAK